MKTTYRDTSIPAIAGNTQKAASPTYAELRQWLPTAAAAKALNRAPQTLRKWACLENGPIRPIRINGRLAWSLDEIAALLNGGQ